MPEGCDRPRSLLGPPGQKVVLFIQVLISRSIHGQVLPRSTGIHKLDMCSGLDQHRGEATPTNFALPVSVYACV